MNYKKIIVCCPYAATGGPEALHQLVNEVCLLGLDAHIAYLPFGKHNNPHDLYSQKYNIKVGDLIDAQGVLVIIPETATWIARKLKKSTVAIWWLSVDNHFSWQRDNFTLDKIRYLRNLILFRSITLFEIKSLINFHQSEYARVFLESHGVRSFPLSDYLSIDHLIERKHESKIIKSDVILYNPKKGMSVTKKLIANFGKIYEFKPLVGYSSSQVKEELEKSKLYIDFGNHPGKDRFPREAAAAGCCIITGRRGSANFYSDMPIDDVYKISDQDPEFLSNFKEAVDNIFFDFENEKNKFDLYRTKIYSERKIFKNEVRDLIKGL